MEKIENCRINHSYYIFIIRRYNNSNRNGILRSFARSDGTSFTRGRDIEMPKS